MIADTPQFFFTASFLQAFAKKYYEALKNAEESKHLDTFKQFIYSSRGSVLIDQNLELAEYPMLRRVFRSDGPQYSVYHKDDNTTYLDSELEAIDKYAASFSTRFSKSQIMALESQYQRPLFNVGQVEKRWYYLAGHDTKTLAEGSQYDWESFLSSFLVPTSQIIICDGYLSTKIDKVRSNLVPLIHALKALVQFKGKIVLISTKPTRGDIHQLIREEFGDSLNIHLVLVESTSIKVEHDRRLITDSQLLNIPTGFDILNDHGIVKRNTEPRLISIFSGDKDQISTHSRLKTSIMEDVKNLIERGVAIS
jgi:hypothetical protein